MILLIACSKEPSKTSTDVNPESLPKPTQSILVDISSAKIGMKENWDRLIEPFEFMENNKCMMRYQGLGEKYSAYCSIKDCSVELKNSDENYCTVYGSGVSSPALEVVFDIPKDIKKETIKSAELQINLTCKYPIFIGLLSKFGDFAPVAKPGSASAGYYECNQPNLKEETVIAYPEIKDDKVVVVVSAANTVYTEFAEAMVNAMKLKISYDSS